MALILTDQNGGTYSLIVDAATGALEVTPVPGVTPTPGAANSITVKGLDIVSAAMTEIGALAAGELPSNDDLTWIFQKLQRLIDRYNARKPMVYNVNFSTFTMVANKSPQTIGPGADFDVIQRPMEIISIGLILPGTPGVEIPLNPRDQAWWAAQTIKDLTSSLPTDFYYSPDWPNGSIYFWPVSTSSYTVRVQSRLVLAQIPNANSDFTMPPAYWDAIVYPLAISICPSFSRSASPELIALSREAVKAIQVNNISSPRLSSDAPSQSTNNNCRPTYSFLTGMSQ